MIWKKFVSSICVVLLGCIHYLHGFVCSLMLLSSWDNISQFIYMRRYYDIGKIDCFVILLEFHSQRLMLFFCCCLELN